MTEAPTSRTGRPAKVPLNRVMEALRAIHTEGNSDHFMQAAEEAGAVVTVHPKAADFVKKYIKDNKLHTHAALNKVVLCPHPHYCPPASSGE
jgi:hypothetical protein